MDMFLFVYVVLILILNKRRIERAINHIPYKYKMMMAISPIVFYLAKFYTWLYAQYVGISPEIFEWAEEDKLIHQVNTFFFITLTYWVMGYCLFILYQFIKEKIKSGKKNI